MVLLSQLRNTSRPTKNVRRIGRGTGSKRGKTSGRGSKGDGSRRGYDRRYGYEGGQVPLYRKLPIRGFTRGRFEKASQAITFKQIEEYFSEGDTVNPTTLREKGLIPRRLPGGYKVLATGDLNKKVTIEAHRFSAAAAKALEAKSIAYTVIEA
jgi:large subunit ribosomal protein L15